jgi:hypothetical protein
MMRAMFVSDQTLQTAITPAPTSTTDRDATGAIVAQSILALPRKGLSTRSSSCGDPKGE